MTFFTQDEWTGIVDTSKIRKIKRATKPPIERKILPAVPTNRPVWIGENKDKYVLYPAIKRFDDIFFNPIDPNIKQAVEKICLDQDCFAMVLPVPSEIEKNCLVYHSGETLTLTHLYELYAWVQKNMPGNTYQFMKTFEGENRVLITHLAIQYTELK